MRFIAALCAIVALTYAVLDSARSYNISPASYVRCLSDLRQCETIIAMYFQEHDSYPLNTIGRPWHQLLADEGYLPESMLTEGRWLDPWGSPFEYFDTKTPEASWSHAYQVPLIFSRGPNGTDERGEGDDVLIR